SSTPATPTFTATLSYRPNPPRVDQTVTFIANVLNTAGTVSGGWVILELHDSLNQIIFRETYASQSFSGDQKAFTVYWPPSSPGSYEFRIQVTDATGTLAYLSTNAPAITVTASPTFVDTRTRDSYGWVSCRSNFTPLSDDRAATLVNPATEL